MKEAAQAFNLKEGSPRPILSVEEKLQAYTEHSLAEAIEPEILNIILQTRQNVQNLTEEVRFQKAKRHFEDAMLGRTTKPDNQLTQNSKWFQSVFTFQTSPIWIKSLYVLSYVFMYLVILENEDYQRKLFLESCILGLFLLDLGMEAYHKSFDLVKKRFQIQFKLKIIVELLLLIDIIIFAVMPKGINSRPFLPFRVLRAFMPLFYDSQARKSLISLFSAYRDILTFIFFYFLILSCFAMLGNVVLRFPPSVELDDYTQGYKTFEHMIFAIYVVATYDAYPDNQIAGYRVSQYYAFFWISFIFLNMFVYTTIPGSLIYDGFRANRSRRILLDQTKRRNSLLLSFVSLGEENRQYTITTSKMARFLMYLYGQRVRYFESVTEIIDKLDHNMNAVIEASEFLRLTKIFEDNKSLMPPLLPDIPAWLSFRSLLIKVFCLKKIVNSPVFPYLVGAMVTLAFINGFFYIYAWSEGVDYIDNIFTVAYCVEILIKIIGMGPEKFKNKKWNMLDTYLVILGLALKLMIPLKILHRGDALLRMARIYRAMVWVDLVEKKCCNGNNDMYRRTKTLYGNIMYILPIIGKFIPFYAVFFYVIGIAGMEVFYNTYFVPESTKYSQYNEFSTFKNFIQSQFLLMQVLTEGGWSMVAYEHAYRNPTLFTPVVLFFVGCHLIIVLLTGNLLKGMFWEVYFSVTSQESQYESRKKVERAYQAEGNEKRVELMETKALILSQKQFTINTPMRRRIHQAKMNETVMLKLFTIAKSISNVFKKEEDNFTILRDFVVNKLLGQDNEDKASSANSKKSVHSNYQKLKRQKTYIEEKKIEKIQMLDEDDFNEEEDALIKCIELRAEDTFSEVVKNPNSFLSLLAKCSDAALLSNGLGYFDPNTAALVTQEAVNYHSSKMRELLDLQMSDRERRAHIVTALQAQGLITEKEAVKILTKKLMEKELEISTEGTITNVFMSQTPQAFIELFEREYFSDIYGKSYKKIDSIRMTPLMKREASLIYALRNLLRFQNINKNEFFDAIAYIEDEISNKLLKEGSLFKLVYRLTDFPETWFTIQFRQSTDMRIHFIKNGVWLYPSDFQNEKVYCARDFFNQPEAFQDVQKVEMLHLLFKTFEGIAFSLRQSKEFFKSTPKETAYDLFCSCIEIPKRCGISHIAIAVLSRQEDRRSGQYLPISFTSIKVVERQKRELFKIEESSREAMRKLQLFWESKGDSTEFDSGEGLPVAYIVNMVEEVRDLLKLYGNTAAILAEKIFTSEFERILKNCPKEN